jgi:hypothetical protein
MYQAIKSLSYLFYARSLLCAKDTHLFQWTMFPLREDPESQSRVSRDSILLFFLSVLSITTSQSDGCGVTVQATEWQQDAFSQIIIVGFPEATAGVMSGAELGISKCTAVISAQVTPLQLMLSSQLNNNVASIIRSVYKTGTCRLRSNLLPRSLRDCFGLSSLKKPTF